MPYATCAVQLCNNNNRNVRGKAVRVKFHRFPPESELSKKWIAFCGKEADWRPSKHNAVCSEHFKDEDYQLDKCSLTKHQNNLRVLKITAVPSIINPKPAKKNSNANNKLVEEKAVEILDPLNANVDTHEAPPKADSMDVEFVNVNDIELGQANKQIIELKCQNKKLLEENEQLNRKLNSFVIKNDILKAKIKRKDEELARISNGYWDSAKVAPIIKEKLKSSLSYNQIDIILDLKKWVNWKMDEISSALTLRYISKRAYKFLAINLNYPLPSLSTLQRHAKTFNLKQGILEDVINMIGSFTRTFPKHGKECVLSFDKMKVCKAMEYDNAADEIMGPFSYMQVVMARGLFQNWKQPVYIGFDKKITNDIINSLIKKLYEIEVNVVGIISNSASTNIACWKNLGVLNSARPFFEHPITNKFVYIIPDSSYLLKEIRNWLLDYGFSYQGNDITSDVLCELVANEEMAKYTPAFELSKSHIIMTSQERQNVRKAAELLSRKTAISLREYYPGYSDAENMADVIEIIALWYRTSNPYSPIFRLDNEKSYNGIQKQISALDKMHDFILNMRVIGESKLQIFQKSVLMQITSIKMLFVNMHEKHQIQKLFTYKLNQDVLDNFFSQIRQINSVYDHPSPLDCLYRIRLMVLGKSPTILPNQTSFDAAVDTNMQQSGQENLTESELTEDFITATLYSSSDITPKPTDLQPPNDTNDPNSDSNDILSSFSSNMADLPMHESDCFEYIVGIIAKKFSTKFPELQLGTYTLNTNNDHSYSHTANFLQHLSDGELFAPSADFLKTCHEMDKIFNEIHPDGQFRYTRNIITKCSRKIENNMKEVPPSIINYFVKLLVNVRIRYMNMKMKNEKSMHPKRKTTAHRRGVKKRKIID